jgi:hypothetical protein
MAAGTLAEIGEAQVGELAQFEADGDQDGIHIDRALAPEFEEEVDQTGIAGAGEGQDELRRLFHRGGPHLERPGRIQLGHRRR